MKLFFILFFIFIFILFFPINLKGKIIYNILHNSGYLSIYYYKLKMFLANLRFTPFIVFIESKKIKASFDIFKKEEQYSFSEIFFKEIFKRVKIKNFRLFSKFGFMRDCMLSCIGSGTMTILSSLTMSLLMNKKTVFNSCIQIFPDFLYSRFLICFTGSITLNLFLIIYCAIVSLLKIMVREVKRNGSKKTS